MAAVGQRTWRVPGTRTKRKAWGYTAQTEDGKQRRVYRAEWTKDDAEKALAEWQLGLDEGRSATTVGGLTLRQASERYLALKSRKRTLAEDQRQLEHLKTAFGAETPLAAI